MRTNLTPYELELVTDEKVIYTKNKIIRIVYELFGELEQEYRKKLAIAALPEVPVTAGKIAKGENYEGLPYVILDLPKVFGKFDLFAIRTFFWWGNFFSVTLQLGGKYFTTYRLPIQQAIADARLESWYINSSEEKWHHHFRQDNYKPVEQSDSLPFENNNFIKLAKKIPLQQWDDVNEFCIKSFDMLIGILRQD